MDDTYKYFLYSKDVKESVPPVIITSKVKGAKKPVRVVSAPVSTHIKSQNGSVILGTRLVPQYKVYPNLAKYFSW